MPISTTFLIVLEEAVPSRSSSLGRLQLYWIIAPWIDAVGFAVAVRDFAHVDIVERGADTDLLIVPVEVVDYNEFATFRFGQVAIDAGAGG